MSESLRDQVKHAYENIDAIPPEKIIELLNQIKGQFRSNLVQEYLNGKIDSIANSNDEEKLSLCKNLKPYLDWYIQGKN